MANRTAPWANSIRGTDPQNLVPKILRTKIYESNYWKAHCFGLTAVTLVDKAIELDHIGGTSGGAQKPTPFICLLLKLLQLQPEKAIVRRFMKKKKPKYVRVLGAFYMRLTGSDTDVYHNLEPLYEDYRKLRRKLADGSSALTHVDEFVEELVRGDFSCDITFPRMKKRVTLESIGLLKGPRKSVFDYLFSVINPVPGDGEEEEDDDTGGDHLPSRPRTRERDLDGRIVTMNIHEDDDRIRDRGRGGRRDHSRDHEDHARHCKRQDEYYHTRSCRSSRDDHHEMRGSSSRNEPKKKKAKKDDDVDPEIAEANRVRASLGLKPLKM